MNTLIVLLGPTGVGKTELSLEIAEHCACPILNCDSRQLFRGLSIGTAAPTPEQLERVKHHFVATLDIHDYYSAARYEEECIRLLSTLFSNHSRLVLSGGAMLYIDAVCQGIDDIPTIDPATREQVKRDLAEHGLEALFRELQHRDPQYAETVDRNNTRRVVHAVELCRMTGQTYTSFRTNEKKKRPFHILKIGLNRPREELFRRINSRVDQMVADGLLEEARAMLPHREANALNTVGYKEMFKVLDGEWPMDMAVERMKKNTRVYAKKQLTWFAKDPAIHWFHPDEKENIFALIDKDGRG
ncbi:MAG: tRNA (adenosine(37)-N6)-dimethylallyltransferase MiaA [Bacteroidaceae bacterium]|nr:tRNA (adenosine(37)-N6)-dimethylallyltransferase MiaA [Bacteroidaceae bacterium]